MCFDTLFLRHYFFLVVFLAQGTQLMKQCFFRYGCLWSTDSYELSGRESFHEMCFELHFGESAFDRVFIIIIDGGIIKQRIVDTLECRF